jgi:hypothetical protein
MNVGLLISYSVLRRFRCILSITSYCYTDPLIRPLIYNSVEPDAFVCVVLDPYPLCSIAYVPRSSEWDLEAMSRNTSLSGYCRYEQEIFVRTLP